MIDFLRKLLKPKNKTPEEKFWSEDVEYTSHGVGLTKEALVKYGSPTIEKLFMSDLNRKGFDSFEEYVEHIRKKVKK